MKVLDVYQGREEFLTLTADRVRIIERFEDYLDSRFPSEFRVNYDRNMKDLTMLRVDEMYDLKGTGEYFPSDNLLMFTKFRTLPHEIVHMATSDSVNRKIAFSSDDAVLESGLIEGMTEYVALDFMGWDLRDSYPFETFCAAMICENKEVFRPFFIPDQKAFINLFSDKKSIYSLMYSLSFYSDKVNNQEDALEYSDKLRDCIRNCIDMLLDIEVDYEKNARKLLRYCERFIGYLEHPCISSLLEEIDDDYLDYAISESYKKLIKKR